MFTSTPEDAITLVAAIVGLLATFWWLASVVYSMAHLHRTARTARPATTTEPSKQRFVLPGARRVASMLLSAGAIGGTLAGCSSGSTAEVPTLVWVDDAASTAAPSTTAPSTTAPSTTAPSTTAPSTTASFDPTEATDRVDPSPTELIEPMAVPAANNGRSHKVTNGEHLWSIACDELRRVNGSSPANEVATYWRAMIEHNRQELFDQSIDIIHPGQVLQLPPVPSAQ